jgi:hypothetical protein
MATTYSLWMEVMRTYCNQECPTFATLFLTPPSYPVNDEPDFPDDGDEDSLKATYPSKYTAFIKKKDKIADDKIRVYAMIHGQVGRSMIDMLSMDPAFIAVSATSDILAYLKALSILCRTGVTYQEDADLIKANRERALTVAFANFKQDKQSDLYAYYQAFCDLIATAKTVGLAEWTESQKVYHYLHGLNPDKYDHLIESISNKIIKIPVTLDAMHKVALSWHTKHTGTPSAGIVFHDPRRHQAFPCHETYLNQSFVTAPKAHNHRRSSPPVRREDQSWRNDYRPQRDYNNSNPPQRLAFMNGPHNPAQIRSFREQAVRQEVQDTNRSRSSKQASRNGNGGRGTQSRVNVTRLVDATPMPEIKARDETQINSRSIVTTAISALSTPLDTSMYLLDTGSTVHLVGPHGSKFFTGEVYKSNSSVSVGGVRTDGEPIVCDLRVNTIFGNAIYSTETVTNVLCAYDLSVNAFSMKFVNDCKGGSWLIRMTREGEVYRFCGSDQDRLYLLQDPTKTSHATGSTAVTTVEGRLAKYGIRDTVAAKAAARLLRSMAGTPPTQVARMIREGNLPGCKVTPADIAAALDIYGPTMEELNGKSTVRRAPPVLVEHVPMVKQQQELHIDLFFVGGRTFLVSVVYPLRFIMVDCLISKSAKDMWPVLLEHIRYPQHRGIKISLVRCDGEGAVSALRSMFAIEGIDLSITSEGGTVPTAERAIRTIKERARGILNTLPFALGSGKLLLGLIQHVVQVINMLPSRMSTTRMSPREQMTGRKINVERDLRASFGDFVMASHQKTDKSMEARSDPCIYLHSSGNEEGSVYLYNINTGGNTTRQHFTPLPMPTRVITRLNTLASGRPHDAENSFQFLSSDGLTEVLDEDEVVDPVETESLPPTIDVLPPASSANPLPDFDPAEREDELQAATVTMKITTAEARGYLLMI